MNPLIDEEEVLLLRQLDELKRRYRRLEQMVKRTPQGRVLLGIDDKDEEKKEQAARDEPNNAQESSEDEEGGRTTRRGKAKTGDASKNNDEVQQPGAKKGSGSVPIQPPPPSSATSALNSGGSRTRVQQQRAMSESESSGSAEGVLMTEMQQRIFEFLKTRGESRRASLVEIVEHVAQFWDSMRRPDGSKYSKHNMKKAVRANLITAGAKAIFKRADYGPDAEGYTLITTKVRSDIHFDGSTSASEEESEAEQAATAPGSARKSTVQTLVGLGSPRVEYMKGGRGSARKRQEDDESDEGPGGSQAQAQAQQSQQQQQQQQQQGAGSKSRRGRRGTAEFSEDEKAGAGLMGLLGETLLSAAEEAGQQHEASGTMFDLVKGRRASGARPAGSAAPSSPVARPMDVADGVAALQQAAGGALRDAKRRVSLGKDADSSPVPSSQIQRSSRSRNDDGEPFTLDVPSHAQVAAAAASAASRRRGAQLQAAEEAAEAVAERQSRKRPASGKPEAEPETRKPATGRR